MKPGMHIKAALQRIDFLEAPGLNRLGHKVQDLHICVQECAVVVLEVTTVFVSP